MDFSFVPALDQLGAKAGVRIANAAKPSAAYLLNTILPERTNEDYKVERANIVIRSTMAGLAAMDSPYPSGGYIEVDTFAENTLKIAIQVGIPEAALRRIQSMLARIQATGGSTVDSLVNETLNFFDKVIMQAHFDMAEYLRGQALTKGAIILTYNGKSLNVDYGVPVGNKFTTRTVVSNDAYGGSASKWWTDVRAAQKILRGGLTAIVMNSTTAHEIIYNAVNTVTVLEKGDNFYVLQRHEERTGANIPSSDARDTVRITIYDGEGDLLDPINNTATPLKFIEDGYVVFVGRNQIRGYEVGQGSTPHPDNDLELGYTHLAPTVEGGGAPGRWGEIYTPQDAPWRVEGRAVANLLPVILSPKKLVIASTELQP